MNILQMRFLEYIYKHQLRYDEIDDVLTQCLQIVHRIHRESYLHYDIKPENIFVKGSRNDKTIVLGDIETMRHTSENIDGTKIGNKYISPSKKQKYLL